MALFLQCILVYVFGVEIAYREDNVTAHTDNFEELSLSADNDNGERECYIGGVNVD